jgi:D-beta-D-heptose 7-phosphate kinase/D-beta-D-heptose 1-phosphate adenosyltransferase
MNLMGNSNDLLKILDKFAQVKILMVGDIMLDRYWWENASRLSPEAPVPVVALQKVSNIGWKRGKRSGEYCRLGAKVF